ncbi:autotransporter outer membrane beta-barrel domain-containing protein [Neisseria sp. Ec49-e6-T10]|uniref:autotransporter outer membrane beta-barrel domain-containing protein n=1 Tax=Neisseria sp. Ec49-e6-T10 TaxID=3140744 RepID=UPI003EC0142A
MNKVYRVVFSQLTGHWVVTSELAKGKTKSNVMKKAATLAATAGLLASANTALAANCSTNLGSGGSLGSTTCIATGTDEDSKLTLTGTGTISDATTHTVRIQGTGAGKGELVSDGNITINNGGVGFGVHVSSGTGGANASFKGNTNITLATSPTADTGVLVTSTGNSSVEITGKFNLTNNAAWRDTELDGIEVNSNGLGNSTLTHTGEGTISVLAGNAIHMNAKGSQGNIVVNLAGTGAGILLKADGDGSKGLSATTGYQNKNAKIIMATNANIETNGANAYGISANTVWVPADGSIPTSEAAGATVDITNTGTIHSNAVGDAGKLAHGIYTLNKNHNTTIKNNGIIITQGDDASGIRAEHTTDSTSGNIEIETGSNSYIETNYANADGIHAIIGSEQTGSPLNNSSNITVIADGVIKTTGNGSAEGIYGAIRAANNTGDITLTFKGASIETTGTGVNRGIYGRQDGTGSLTIEHFGQEIKTWGDSAHGIVALSGGSSSASTTSGDFLIQSTGKITTYGDAANGIYATLKSNAQSLIINNTGDITTSGDGASAIRAVIDYAGLDSHGMTINQLGGTLSTSGSGTAGVHADSHGIIALTNAISGDINVNVKDTMINLKGSNSDGIDIQNTGTGASNLNINIITEGGEINTLDPTLAATGNSNYGIVAIQAGAAAGEINIKNIGTKVSTGLAQDGLAPSSAAIFAQFKDATATGKATIINSGELSTQGAGAAASTIRIAHAGSGDVEVTNIGLLTTEGKDAAGIYVDSKGGNVVIDSHGVINTTNARGIYARSVGDDLTLIATNNITTGQVAGDVVHNHGIDVGTTKVNGKVTVDYSDGTIKVVGNTVSGGNAIGIAAWDAGSGATGVNATINLHNNAIVDATEGVGGLQIRSNGVGTIKIDASSQVHGGSGYGIHFKGTDGTDLATHVLENNGVVDALTDHVIMSDSVAGSTLTVNNYGTVTGYVTGGAEDSTFNNYSSNSFNIRNFADTDGDLIRDTKAVAISNFGGGNDVFKNELTGTVRLAAVTGESTVDTTNEYITSGALSINNTGIVQGQLLNLNTFENRGTIDLTENKRAGDILVIGGGATAGIYGGGLFVSDGGTLKLDTVLNEGDVNSLSDILVIDDSIAGAGGATALEINVISDAGQKTQGEGIKVIETLGTSSANSFKLAKPMVSGLYEYVLGQGSADQNWYLSNMFDKNNPLFNPATGAYLANQTAASALFMHTLYDRQGHANNIAGGSEKKSSVWVRAATSNTKNDSVNGNMKVDTDSNLIHLGGDIGKWQVQEGNLHLGLMGAYGQTESDVRSKKTGTTAKGKVTGYSVGLYGTWFADEAQGKGLYVDSWAQYGWYKNKVSGQGQTEKEEKYDSNNWAVSLEAGYGMHLATRGNTEIMLTPQVQVTYNNYSADDHQDRNKLKVSGSKADDVITRVGARLYGRAIEGYSAKPFIEANWLHHTAKNELSFNGEVLKDGVPKDRAEAKLGLQGTISKNWKVWGQVGAQWGGDNYTRYEGQAGLNYQW